MRLILDSRFKDEIKDRLEYMFEVFNIYMIVKEANEKYVEAISIPDNVFDYTFVIGHTGFVFDFLNTNPINTSNLILISCNSEMIVVYNKMIRKNINIYITKSKTPMVNLVSGTDYGFNYNLTEAEIDLFNFRNYDDKVEKTFKLIKERKNDGKDYRKNGRI